MGPAHSVAIEQLEDRALLSVAALGTPSSQYLSSNTLSGFTVSAGTNRVLIVAVSDPNSSTPASAVTFNGQSMSLGTSVNDGGAASDTIWYLALGTGGAITGQNVVATTTGTHELFFGASVYSGVDQTTHAVAGPSDHDPNGDNATKTVNVTSKAGDLAFDLFDAYKQSAVNSVTIGGSQTLVADQSGAIAAQGNAHYLTSTEPGASPTVAMSWSSEVTHTGATATLHASIDINQSASNPTVNLSVDKSAGSEAGTTVVTVTATASSAVSGSQTVDLGVSEFRKWRSPQRTRL